MFGRALLTSALCMMLAWFGSGPSSQGHSTIPQDTASASVEEFTHAYLQWLKHHPAAIQGSQMKLEMPIMDLYSPAGISIYYGADSAKNAAFLQTLPQGIAAAKTTAVRPSLREAIEMFPEFKAQEEALLADARYTVFAVTFPDWDACKQQNEAVAKLRARAGQTGIRILEVRLHR